MTFSLLARDPQTGEIGAAVATGTPVVGGFVLHPRPGAGALATQGYSTNTLYGPQGLTFLETGVPAGEVCRRLTEADEGREWRQLIVIDEAGRTAGWTGARNVGPMLHLDEPDLVVAGNWIASAEVVHETRRAYLDARDRPMMERLLAALAAGVDTGGDSRGTRSAAASVVSRHRAPLGLRVDLDDAPVARLRDIHRATQERDFLAFLERIPTLDDPMRY
jgi:uncharacterized Ntn-hydrolase superfamily protein